MGEGTFRIPDAAWKHRFNQPLDEARGPSRLMGWRAILKMLPMIVRMAAYTQKRRNNGFDPMNMAPPKSPGPYQGVPLGGIGAGSIGRGWRGDFRRWQLRSGYVHNEPVYANQFSLFVQRDGLPGTAQVLFPGRPEDGSLSGWNWDMPAAECEYRALFPRAWTIYESPLPGMRLTCRQLSPVIAHNYKESSYPVSEFRWKIENTTREPLTVGLMFSFQNGMGQPGDLSGGHVNQSFHIGEAAGVVLHHAYQQQQTADPDARPRPTRTVYDDPLSFAIAGRTIPVKNARDIVSWRTRFVTSGDGVDLWSDFSADGRLDNSESSTPSAPGESIGAAVAVTVRLEPGEVREVAFALAWDMPRYRSGYGTPYLRRYTHFYGSSGRAAQKMACDALLSADEWEAQINTWQQPILGNKDLPAWYRLALFNELYYLVDGGTLWSYPDHETYPQASQPPDPEMGHFGYLEGHEYRMYNTYDVHFYASFALIQLWPKLELALQCDLAAATLADSKERFTELYTGKKAPRKLRGAVPHDVGWPDEDPWRKVNGYFLHDVNNWKDLNPKFVLQIYRDYLATGDQQFVLDTWPAVEAALAHVQRFDRDNDGLIENDGFPDQTYDVWSVKGASAYTGGLWLAALSAAICLAELAGRPECAREYARLLAKGSQAYESKLWNGRYYNYDSSRSLQHDSIMADQLAGQWYARACGLDPIVNPVHVRAALATVYDWNVLRFNNGTMGAVNGMRPDGHVDQTSMQSQEVWTGTSYALAAALIQEGLQEAGFQTAWGVYHMTYEVGGYWFQTPEAWDTEGNYRSIAYMRPLSIWAMQWALERK